VKLRHLLPEVLDSFSSAMSGEVLATKGGQLRDVVTALDLRLHAAAESFAKNSGQPLQLLSEEGQTGAIDLSGLLLIVDPLDGSNNFALGMPEFGFMGCILENRKFVESLIVIPEQKTYLTWSLGELLLSRPIEGSSGKSAPVYLAYPPSLDSKQKLLRAELVDTIDSLSAGFYRSGSACGGLYRLITGQHSAFIGINVRLWDVVSYFPILDELGFTILYDIDGTNCSVFVTRNQELLREVSRIWHEFFAVMLNRFELETQLVWENYG
jgi:myo-inositol-1(or 4)-monophosphatase